MTTPVPNPDPSREVKVTRSLGELKSQTPDIRRDATQKLALLGDARALDALMDVAANDVAEDVRAAAATAVEDIKQQIEPPPEDFLSEESDRFVTSTRRAPSTTEEMEAPSGLDDDVSPVPGKEEETAQLPPIEPEKRVSRSAAENARSLARVRTWTRIEATTQRALLVREALENTPIKRTPRPYGWKLEVPLPLGRRQFVRIGYDRSDFEHDKIIVLASPCGPADHRHYRWALDLNYALTWGKLAIERTKRGEIFVMMATLLEATADPAELRKAVLSIAEKADKIESLFGPEDRY